MPYNVCYIVMIQITQFQMLEFEQLSSHDYIARGNQKYQRPITTVGPSRELRDLKIIYLIFFF